MDTIKSVRVKDVIFGDNVRDINRKELAKSELYASIKQFGIRIPVTVVPFKDGYKLTAGFRRFICADLLKLEHITCHVLDGATSEGDTALHNYLENAHRQDLSFMEQAEAALLLNEKLNDPKMTALALGISPATLAKRLALSRLAPEVKDAINNKGAWIPMHHLDMLAPLSHEMQATIIDRHYDKRTTTRQLQACIDDLCHEIKRAKFATIACAKCKHNTAAASVLFPEYAKSARCTEYGCWTAKTEAMVTTKIKAFADEHKDGVLVNLDYQSITDSPLPVRKEYDVKKGTAADLKAGKAIMAIDTKGNTHIVLKAKVSDATSKKQGPKLDKKQKSEGLVLAKSVDLIIAAILKAKDMPACTNLSALAVQFGAKFHLEKTDSAPMLFSALGTGKKVSYSMHSFEGGHMWSFTQKQVTMNEILWNRIQAAMIESLHKKPTASQALKERGWMLYVSSLVGFDLTGHVATQLKK